MKYQTPYLLSIEPSGGKTFHHGFHLGTDLALAKTIAEERFHAVPGIKTVAILDSTQRIVDVFDGCWDQDRAVFNVE